MDQKMNLTSDIKHSFENPVTMKKEVNWIKVGIILLGILIFLGIGIMLGAEYYSKINTKASVTDIDKLTSTKETNVIVQDTDQIKTKLTIPAEILANKYGFPSGSPSDVDVTKQLGGLWVRPHIGPFVWNEMQTSKTSEIDFAKTDRFVTGYGIAKVGTLATIWPYAQWDQDSYENQQICNIGSKDLFAPPDPEKINDGKDMKKLPPKEELKEGQAKKIGKEENKNMEEQSFLPRFRCNPYDWDAYLAWVKALVERYDGDGINDMPELTIPIKYWEVLNEPDLNDHPDLDFYAGGPNDYAQLLLKTSQAIKNTDPDAKVLIAGAAGGNSNFLNFYRQVFTDKQTHTAFDIGNVHCISNDDYTSFNVEPYKKMLSEFGLNKSIWVTEAETLISNDSNINANQTYASTKKAISLGAERFIYSSHIFDRGIGKMGNAINNLTFDTNLDGNDPESAYKEITSL